MRIILLSLALIINLPVKASIDDNIFTNNVFTDNKFAASETPKKHKKNWSYDLKNGEVNTGAWVGRNVFYDIDSNKIKYGSEDTGVIFGE